METCQGIVGASKSPRMARHHRQARPAPGVDGDPLADLRLQPPLGRPFRPALNGTIIMWHS